MATKYAVQITNNETNEVETREVEGFVLLGVTERREDGFDSLQDAMNVNAMEVTKMLHNLSKAEPRVKSAIKKMVMTEMMAEVIAGKLFGNSKPEDAEDDCDCENCVSRREKEATNASETH